MDSKTKEALNRFKMECASEVGVSLKQGYNGDLSSKQAGSIGGQIAVSAEVKDEGGASAKCKRTCFCPQFALSLQNIGGGSAMSK